MADTTSAARSHPETPPSPAWVRASTPAGWRPPQPTRRQRGRPWRPGCRMPGRCGLSDRVARRPKSERRHPQRHAFPRFAWRRDRRPAPLLPGQAQSGAQPSDHGPGPTPTGPRYDSGSHSHPVRIHAYLSCSTYSRRKHALTISYSTGATDNALLPFRNAKVGLARTSACCLVLGYRNAHPFER